MPDARQNQEAALQREFADRITREIHNSIVEGREPDLQRVLPGDAPARVYRQALIQAAGCFNSTVSLVSNARQRLENGLVLDEYGQLVEGNAPVPPEQSSGLSPHRPAFGAFERFITSDSVRSILKFLGKESITASFFAAVFAFILGLVLGMQIGR